MATETKSTIKHTCDRCGSTEEFDIVDGSSIRTEQYPKAWQYMKLGQTGAELDLCNSCNEKLLVFLKEEGAENMEAACIRKEEVI